MRALHLSFNGIGPAGAELIAEALMHNRTIQELFLTDNAVGDAGAAALAVTMASHPELSDVKLCGNSIGNQGVQHIANTAIRADNHALKRIDLSYNKFDDNGARSLADAMRVNTHQLVAPYLLTSFPGQQARVVASDCFSVEGGREHPQLDSLLSVLHRSDCQVLHKEPWLAAWNPTVRPVEGILP